jgi:hypothetical protein
MLTSPKTNVIAKHIIESFIVFEERKGAIINPGYLIAFFPCVPVLMTGSAGFYSFEIPGFLKPGD